MLRKYIMYAREKVRPKLTEVDQDKLAKLFSELRRESLSTGSFPITVRHLESMIRMAEASAKMHLREYVRRDDVDLAISVTIGSFVSAQKLSIKKSLERVRVSFDLEKVFLVTVLPVNRASGNISVKRRITKRFWPSSWANLSKRKCTCTNFSITRCLPKFPSQLQTSKRG